MGGVARATSAAARKTVDAHMSRVFVSRTRWYRRIESVNMPTPAGRSDRR